MCRCRIVGGLCAIVCYCLVCGGGRGNINTSSVTVCVLNRCQAAIPSLHTEAYSKSKYSNDISTMSSLNSCGLSISISFNFHYCKSELWPFLIFITTLLFILYYVYDRLPPTTSHTMFDHLNGQQWLTYTLWGGNNAKSIELNCFNDRGSEFQ